MLSQASGSLQMLFPLPGMPSLVCLPSQGLCILCHLKGCSSVSLRWLPWAPFLVLYPCYPCTIYHPVWSLQVCLPTGLWALRSGVWDNTGLTPRVTEERVLLVGTQGHQKQEQGSLSWFTNLIKHGVRLALTSLHHQLRGTASELWHGSPWPRHYTRELKA